MHVLMDMLRRRDVAWHGIRRASHRAHSNTRQRNLDCIPIHQFPRVRRRYLERKGTGAVEGRDEHTYGVRGCGADLFRCLEEPVFLARHDFGNYWGHLLFHKVPHYYV